MQMVSFQAMVVITRFSTDIALFTADQAVQFEIGCATNSNDGSHQS